MWKDFFYFSKGQRIGIVTLFCLIIIVIAANYALPLFFPVREPTSSSFLTEAESFKKDLVKRDSLRQAEWDRKFKERQQQFADKYKHYPSYETYNKTEHYNLFTFDPNKIDSSGLVGLGLKPYIASNILKYRKAGGVFHSADDFGKVYGISQNKLKELEPYISIAEIKQENAKPATEKRTDIIVELNSADTTSLMQIKGIGRGYAKGIVRFRQASGGFVSIEQLKEIYGMRPENYERIRPYCKVNPCLVQKIKVNIASAERLNAHPYLNFYQAKAIYELRRKQGKLHNIEELKDITELSADDLTKIKPYLSFE